MLEPVPTPEPEKPDYFKNGVIVLLTLLSVFAATTTLLQNFASLRGSDLAEQSSFKAVNATGLYFSAGLASAQGTDVLQRYKDYLQSAVRADTKAKALRMGGQSPLAAEYDLDASRWQTAAAQVATSNPLLTQYGSDQSLYSETLLRDGYLEEEREQTLLQQSRLWNDKANSYVAVLSTLSVALFLAGLSLTLSSRLRYVMAMAGVALALGCAVWTLFIVVSPVPQISEAAIQHFVDGRIKYDLDNQRGANATDAIPDFDAAIKLAPTYSRVYFYRSLANTDSSLENQHLDAQQAINDALKSISLGNATAPVYGNLGWLYYLKGQYNSALSNTEKALALSPNECYLPFNHGLILAALGRPVDSAYGTAIDCALRQSSDYKFSYYMDTGVADLQDLAQARPDLKDKLQPMIRRLKEGLAQTRMYGQLQTNAVDATFEAPTFGSSLDQAGNVSGLGDQFPQTTTILYAQLKFTGMKPDSRWMARWLLDGQEYLSTVYDKWDYGASGQAWVSVFNNAGLNSGTYNLDIFVDGQLVGSGSAVVLPGQLPPMTAYASTGVGVNISYPQGWAETDIADNEVSVVAARDPLKPTFFGVTAWVASTGTDNDIFQLFKLYLDAVKQNSQDFTSEQRQPFIVASSNGWFNAYQYTDKDGNVIHGGLAGVLDAQKKFTYIVVIECNAADWDPQLPLFNVMLNRMTITRTQ